MKTFFLAALLGSAALVSGNAQAATLTFGPGTYSEFNGSTVESGFTYREQFGALFVGRQGNPDGDMEGYGAGGGGVLGITSLSGLFTFTGLDYAAYADSGTGNQTLVVWGFLGASIVGSEAYNLANTGVTNPSYPNWTAFSASGLAGLNIDRLEIVLNGGDSPTYFYQAVDNVTLGAANAVPEPATWAMMIGGLALVGATMRRKIKTVSFA